MRLLILGLALLPLIATAHPDKVEQSLLTHFATGSHPITNNQWSDLTHQVTAKVLGAPELMHLGPSLGLMLNGASDGFILADSPDAAKAFLPKREMSVAAWVMLHETANDGGIIALAQDNMDYEKGWILGYDKQQFSFALASTAADDGNGKMTFVKTKSTMKLDRWHHVAGTYDGKTMRLYLDGKLEGESREQSGDILYPPKGRYVMGGYADDNEITMMEGAMFEVKVYGRVLAETEIADVVAKNKGLLEYRGVETNALKFVVKPYLQFGTLTSMTVMCETDHPSQMTVAFGEFQPLTNKVSRGEFKNISEVTLTGLRPNTVYYYRVTCVDANSNILRSDVHSLQTAPTADQPWAFGILGDTQRNPEVTRKCAEGIFALRPNFMLHCGDVVDDGFAKNQWVGDLFEPGSRLFAYVPMFPVIGNHEKNSHWYYDYFSLPDPEYYYTYTYGNAQFFMIDSNKDCKPGSEQYQRIERDLKASKATWKFAAHHHPCFSSDEDDYGERWKGSPLKPMQLGDNNARHLVPLYEKYGVDIAFAGHIHSYERTWPILQMAVNAKQGVRYIISGGGGGGLEQAAPQRAWFSLHVQRGHHYCFATIHDRTIQFKAYDIEGRLFDTFEMTKPEGR